MSVPRGGVSGGLPLRMRSCPGPGGMVVVGCLADPGPCGWGVLLQARDKVLLAPFSRQELTGRLLCARWCFRLWGPRPVCVDPFLPPQNSV